MAKEKGRVLLFGRRWSGRTTVANMLASGETRDCPLNPKDMDSICQTYVGRGWTVIDTMGFGEPVDDLAPDEYATEMGIDFLKELRGTYSHIIFVLDGREFGVGPLIIEERRKHTLSMWKTFLEIFRGGEEGFLVLVTKVTPQEDWPHHSRKLEERFPECKRFLYSDFWDDDGEEAAVMRGEALEKLEKEIEEMCKGRPWVEPNVANMGEVEIKEMAARIIHQLISVGDPEWATFYDFPRHKRSRPSSWRRRYTLEQAVQRILDFRDEMENLGKKVKIYPEQCEYLLRRTKDATKEIHDLIYGNEMDRKEAKRLEPLIKSLSKVRSSVEAVKELLHLCGEGVDEEVVLVMFSRTDSGRNSFSKFGMVLRDLEWSLDLFRFWWHIVIVEGLTESALTSWSSKRSHHLSATESEQNSWRSKFSWCETRRRFVFVGDGENGVVDTEFVESSVDGDNERHAQDQQGLISSMESYLRNPPQVEMRLMGCVLVHGRRKEQLSDSERLNYMSVLKNRLQGDLPLQDDLTVEGPSCSSLIPRCFQIPINTLESECKSVKLIGSGSFKDVFKSKWLGMNVALATCKSGNMERAPTYVLEAEVEMLARVQHPNVVTLIGYSYDKEKQQGFLVTELLKTSLEYMINRAMFNLHSLRPFTFCNAVHILLQIAEAMVHVHECGVIH